MFMEVIIVARHNYTVNQHFLEFITTKDLFFHTEYNNCLVSTLLYISFTIVSDDHKLHERNCKTESSSKTHKQKK